MKAGDRVTDGERIGTISIVDDAAGRPGPTALGRWDDGTVFSVPVATLAPTGR